MTQDNYIIEQLRGVAAMNWAPEQKAFFEQRAADARPVECVRMRDVFSKEQMEFLRENYRARRNGCYENSSALVNLIANPIGGLFFDRPIWYVEGLALSCGVLPIEHAFVKYGDVYIDPTFERALKRDVRKEMYVSLIVLDPVDMNRYQCATGFYGDLYKYDYLQKNRPELAAKFRALNPHVR